MHSNKREPAIRIDGGKRVNLAELRARRKESADRRSVAPPVEDTRVSEAWQRDQLRSDYERETAPQRKRIAKLINDDGGKEGAKIATVKVRISEHRHDNRAIRARPGTFEWRYGRNKQDALFHAGNHLARLWERAGMTVASSADFMRGTGSGYVTGLAEGRVAALDKLDGFRETLGLVASGQLIDYCVVGLASAEVARKSGVKEREMATVLHHNLTICAKHFDFM